MVTNKQKELILAKAVKDAMYVRDSKDWSLNEFRKLHQAYLIIKWHLKLLKLANKIVDQLDRVSDWIADLKHWITGKPKKYTKRDEAKFNKIEKELSEISYGDLFIKYLYAELRSKDDLPKNVDYLLRSTVREWETLKSEKLSNELQKRFIELEKNLNKSFYGVAFIKHMHARVLLKETESNLMNKMEELIGSKGFSKHTNNAQNT